MTLIPAWPSPNYEWFPWSICNGCGMPAGNAYPSRHLVPSPFLGRACAPIVETRFLELAMSLLDFSPWIPLGTFSILLQNSQLKCLICWGRSIACPIRMSLYIFLLYHIYHLCFTCIDFYDLSAWGGCWFDVYIRRFIYKFLNVCPFNYTAVAGSGKVGPVNQVNHTSWVAVVTPTDRPKSVPNRCLIDLFCGVVCVVTLPFWHFRGCGGFCHRTESDLLLFVVITSDWNLVSMRIKQK